MRSGWVVRKGNNRHIHMGSMSIEGLDAYGAMIEASVRAGMSDPMIARRLQAITQRKIGPSTVRRWRGKHGLRAGEAFRPALKAKHIKSVRARLDAGKTEQEIATEFGVSKTAVNIFRRAHGIGKPVAAHAPIEREKRSAFVAAEEAFREALRRRGFCNDVKTACTGKLWRPEPTLHSRSQMASMVGEDAA